MLKKNADLAEEATPYAVDIIQKHQITCSQVYSWYHKRAPDNLSPGYAGRAEQADGTPVLVQLLGRGGVEWYSVVEIRWIWFEVDN